MKALLVLFAQMVWQLAAVKFPPYSYFAICPILILLFILFSPCAAMYKISTNLDGLCLFLCISFRLLFLPIQLEFLLSERPLLDFSAPQSPEPAESAPLF